MTHEELTSGEVWECWRDGFVEYFRINNGKVIKAGPKYEHLTGRATGTVRQILRKYGWEINVYHYNLEGTHPPCQ